MDESYDELKAMIRKVTVKSFESYIISKAMYDDYCALAARVENLDEREIRSRMKERMDLLVEELKIEFPNTPV